MKSHSEKQLTGLVKKYDKIIIFGAGMVGELTGRRLLAKGLGEKIIGAAVSKKSTDMAADEKLCGLRIYEIAELEKYKDSAVVIVAALPNLHEEIKRILSELRFKNVIFVTERLYQDLSRRYMMDYTKENPIAFPTDAKTKILFMASDNNKVSGAFLCMAELCEQLQNKGIAAAVVLPHYGTGTSLLLQKNIPHTYIRSYDWAYEITKNSLWDRWRFLRGLLSNGGAERKLIRFIKGNQVDLVHCNTTYTYVGAAAAKKCGIPFVWHLRENLEHQGYRIFAYKKALKFMQQAGKIIAVSDYIKGLMPFKKGMVVTVYDAVGMKGDPCPEKKILSQKVVQLIQVGILTQFKGQKELIEACAILKSSRDIDFHLLLVGKGTNEYIDELKQMIRRYGLENEISFYGASSNVYELYAQSDFSFMCSRKEAYGRVSIESQLSGCLLIGVDSGGTPELIKDGETGYLYKAGDPKALADTIWKAATDPILSRKIARDGQEYAQKTYTKERNLRQVMDIYEEVLGRSV